MCMKASILEQNWILADNTNDRISGEEWIRFFMTNGLINYTTAIKYSHV